MKIEILASVMNQKNKDEIVKRLGISDSQKCLIVDQVAGGGRLKDDVGSNHRFISFNEKGLSKSRNHALDLAKGEIVLLSDDDCEYVKGYEGIVRKAYQKYPDADIIAFSFAYDYMAPKKLRREGRVGFLKSMGISSAQISCKVKSIKRAGVKFDERFGTGSGKYNWGEENIFLFDCLRMGLRIYYVPIIIIIKSNFGSTWDKSNTPKHFEQQGAIYYRMSSRWWRVLALQFVLRKRKIYGKDMGGWAVYRAMVRGAKAYRREEKNG